MTALNVIVGGLAAYIVTDTAVYTRESHIAKCFAPKVATIPHLPAAVGVSGPAGLVHLFGSVIYAEATELDELMTGGITELVGAAGQLLSTAVRIVVAGWSRRDGAVAWHFSGDRFVPRSRGEASGHRPSRARQAGRQCRRTIRALMPRSPTWLSARAPASPRLAAL
jgi:hypothetical protein